MSSEVLVDQVSQVISSVFSVPANLITSDTSYETIENWDSMGHLMLILELEQRFNLQFEPEQVERMTSVRAILDVLHGTTLASLA